MKFWLAASLLALSLSASGESIIGEVVGVTDGDTLTLLNGANRQIEIRLFAIDSPETSCHAHKPSRRDVECVERGQPFGKAAKRSLSEMAFGKMARVVLQPGDSYGRLIGTVWVDGVDVNAMQVARGYAWHYQYYARKGQTHAEFNQYQQAEEHARNQRVGLWADAAPVEPWNYRKAR